MLTVPALALAAAVAAAAPAPASAPQRAAAAEVAPAPAESDIERHVAEDDHVRVEELRVRGESRRIVVKPKAPGAKEYEIVPSSAARDPSKAGNSSAGERVWRLFSF